MRTWMFSCSPATSYTTSTAAGIASGTNAAACRSVTATGVIAWEASVALSRLAARREAAHATSTGMRPRSMAATPTSPMDVSSAAVSVCAGTGAVAEQWLLQHDEPSCGATGPATASCEWLCECEWALALRGHPTSAEEE